MSTGRMARKSIWLALICLVIPLAVILTRIPNHRPFPQSREFTAVFVDVGQGDCTFLRTPSGRTILVDGGGRPSSSDDEGVGRRVVEPFLRAQGINRIDLVVVSHPHDDHIKGLVPIVEDFQIGSVLDPGIPHASASYRHFLRLVKSKQIKYRLAVRGQQIDFGDGVKARVLNPPKVKIDGTSDDVNNNSTVLRFTYGRSSLILMGDAGVEAEDDMIRSGEIVKGDVIKIGHHGSNTASSDEWLDAVGPKAAVISVGRKNSFGHPSGKVLRKLSSRRIKVYRTDRNGAVTVRFSGNGYTINSYKPASKD